MLIACQASKLDIGLPPSRRALEANARGACNRVRVMQYLELVHHDTTVAYQGHVPGIEYGVPRALMS